MFFLRNVIFAFVGVVLGACVLNPRPLPPLDSVGSQGDAGGTGAFSDAAGGGGTDASYLFDGGPPPQDAATDANLRDADAQDAEPQDADAGEALDGVSSVDSSEGGP